MSMCDVILKIRNKILSSMGTPIPYGFGSEDVAEEYQAKHPNYGNATDPKDDGTAWESRLFQRGGINIILQFRILGDHETAAQEIKICSHPFPYIYCRMYDEGEIPNRMVTREMIKEILSKQLPTNNNRPYYIGVSKKDWSKGCAGFLFNFYLKQIGNPWNINENTDFDNSEDVEKLSDAVSCMVKELLCAAHEYSLHKDDYFTNPDCYLTK